MVVLSTKIANWIIFMSVSNLKNQATVNNKINVKITVGLHKKNLHIPTVLIKLVVGVVLFLLLLLAPPMLLLMTPPPLRFAPPLASLSLEAGSRSEWQKHLTVFLCEGVTLSKYSLNLTAYYN